MCVAEDLKEAPAPSRSQGTSPAATSRVGPQQLRKPHAEIQLGGLTGRGGRQRTEGREACRKALECSHACFKTEGRTQAQRPTHSPLPDREWTPAFMLKSCACPSLACSQPSLSQGSSGSSPFAKVGRLDIWRHHSGSRQLCELPAALH